MNTYIGFYQDQEIEIRADSLYAAKIKAVEAFNPPKSKQYMVHVHLAAKNNQEIVHIPID